MTQTNYSMLYIEAEKARVRAEMKKLRLRMKDKADDLLAPPPENTRTQRVMNAIERGVALWDGLWTGYKVVKVLSLFLPGKKKK